MNATPTLLIPGLIWPLQALRDITQGLPTPALRGLLGRGRVTALPPCDLDDAVARRCGVHPPLPAAALRRIGLGARPDEHGHWLCLDPVHFSFVERRLQLADPARLELREEEARDLIAALAPLFAEFGELEATGAAAWHLRLHPGTAAPSLPPLSRAVGTRADAGLDQFDRAWRLALNEAQVLLHAHAVNRSREASGRPPVNSLWPWGGGMLPAPIRAPFDVCLTDSPVFAGLARHLGARAAALPARWPAEADATATLAVLDTLATSASAADALAWRKELARLDAEWFAPLLAALDSGRLGSLELEFTGPRGGHLVRIGGGARWTRWMRRFARHRIAPLEVLAEP